MISTTSVHAVCALTTLTGLPPEEHAGAGAIAKQISAWANYLGRLLQMLARQGVVTSRNGMGGGFRLARDPGGLSPYEVIESLDHLERRGQCIVGNGRCETGALCAMHKRWKPVEEAYSGFLKETTIADLTGRDGST
ncbi:MAG: hypothetical protein CO096_09070 [Armatimonadetes bacterium CG_4_9_14_3_um_filter_66_14]|nr:Rrf2 family transcriptional regulator [Armatimonadota bacterium]PIU91285.1 MAG: hypothetical protein COS65_22395 [Armatimonadetes bacterium CG06_land_8_20_14_3_00_66_21]PJB71737.1 MAG: hypothetical protein CO096_09070 [Armatimonadetes bacterium CG_4_9_14_3_um_filter_66_14]